MVEGRKQVIIHFFNGLNTAANHGLPTADVPLREEVVPIHGIEVRFSGDAPTSVHWEPGDRVLTPHKDETVSRVSVPPLEVHAMLVAKW
jgi:hypothetical protein